MIVVNTDNSHLLTHRYGWHKIILSLSNYIESSIVLVDYMDKYFNLWYDFDKDIISENNEYKFSNKDAYYYINDVEKSDVFIHYDEFNLYHIIKWFPEYNQFKTIPGEIIQHFKKKSNIYSVLKPWIGFIHYPEFVPEMNYTSFEALPNILKSNTFKESLPQCKCIITLSEHSKKYLLEQLEIYNYKVPVEVLFHPTDFTCLVFSLDKYNLNLEKKIIQVGFWMRKLNTIYKLNTNKYKKYWLPGGKYWKDTFNKTYKDDAIKYLSDTSVNICMFLSNENYDELLSENIVLLDVFNSSANNTVLECIARNTPLITVKHPAIVEYLGEDYPLYFSNVEDLNNIINSNDFDNMINKAYNYLKKMDKTIFTLQYFCESFDKIVKKYYK